MRCHQAIRRLVLMDDLHQNNRVLVVDILSMIDEEDQEDDMNSECQISEGIGKSSHRIGRSFLNGRFFPTRPSRARNTILPA
ncbi:hypothetical protein Prudu_688S000200 [Prunus dulcis]|uniref:Uncharacterized protein n=1 Tax=Prunus dulcis TaxID=3755 RepID=A0A5H2XS86_PRUDU|nr:hypothetical protein Prudu_688S000200 [Prunus dulcis]